jgi:hypothetical protein
LLHGKEQEAKEVLADIAKRNGTVFCYDWEITGRAHGEEGSSGTGGDPRAASTLITNSKLRGITVIQILSW